MSFTGPSSTSVPRSHHHNVPAHFGFPSSVRSDSSDAARPLVSAPPGHVPQSPPLLVDLGLGPGTGLVLLPCPCVRQYSSHFPRRLRWLWSGALGSADSGPCLFDGQRDCWTQSELIDDKLTSDGCVLVCVNVCVCSLTPECSTVSVSGRVHIAWSLDRRL